MNGLSDIIYNESMFTGDGIMSYILDETTAVLIPNTADGAVISGILSNYTYGMCCNVKSIRDDNCITAGDFEKAELTDAEYVINVTENGMYIKGSDYSALMRGFFTMLEKIRFDKENERFYIDECVIAEKPYISFRCVHLCIFPETKLEFLQKCMRSCALAKFSHIILEFWGMIKFDCMKELSWPFAYEKEDIKKLTAEVNTMGVEIIPMFNCLGHASACREINGKHVVLDQNPKYEYMFDSYGWVWNYKRKDVRELLSKIRDELIDVCGKGNYFHIGCDEAYAVGEDEWKAEETAEYLNSVAEELRAGGRRAIMWHDMLLSNDGLDGYVANSDKNTADILLKKLDKDIIIADWEYTIYNGIWKSSQKLSEAGFDVVCCPWNNEKNVDSAVETAAGANLYGIIETTWNSLHLNGFRTMVYAGAISYDESRKNYADIFHFYCAYIARKAMPAYGKYEKGGWSERMTGAGL